MQSCKVVHLVMQGLAAFMFCYQAFTAFSKYASKQTVTSSTTIFKQRRLHKISVMICAREQFDFAAAKRHGYDDQHHVMQGFMKNRSLAAVSWHGNRNLTFDALIAALYKADYKHMSVWPPRASRKDVFRFYRGRCKLIKHLREDTIIIGFRTGWYEAFVLGYQHTTTCGIPAEYFTGDRIQFKASDNGSKSYTVFFEVVKKDQSLGTCRSYGADDVYRNRAECVIDHLAKRFKSVLKCVPPWLSETIQMNETCQSSLNLKPSDLQDYTELTSSMVGHADFGLGCLYNFEASCLEACRSLNVYTQERKLMSCNHVKSWVNLLTRLLIGCLLMYSHQESACLLTQLLTMTKTHKFSRPELRSGIFASLPASLSISHLHFLPAGASVRATLYARNNIII